MNNSERAAKIVNKITAMEKHGNYDRKEVEREIESLLPPVVDLEVLRLQPGDMLAMNCTEGSTDDARDFAREISADLPAGASVLIVPPGWKLQRVPKAGAESSEFLSRVRFVLQRIIDDLPARRDWLDPTIEREARYVLGFLP